MMTRGKRHEIVTLMGLPHKAGMKEMLSARPLGASVGTVASAFSEVMEILMAFPATLPLPSASTWFQRPVSQADLSSQELCVRDGYVHVRVWGVGGELNPGPGAKAVWQATSPCSSVLPWAAGQP